LTGQVFATGRPIVVDDYWAGTGAEPAFSPSAGTGGQRALVWKGRFSVCSKLLAGRTAAPFPTSEVNAMSLLATQAAIAIQNARLYDAAQQRARELSIALAQQREIDRWKAEFIQNVSHELRTPRSPSSRGTRDAERRVSSAIYQRNSASRSRSSPTRRRRCRRWWPICCYPPGRGQAMQPEPTSLADLMQAAVDDFQGLISQSGLTLETDVQPDTPLVSADPRQLRKVVDNLLSNAVKFTPAGGRLATRVYPYQGGACLRVSDNRHRHPARQLDRVFERFYQVDGSIRRQYEGAGLGLALAREIVEGHGGWIQAESEGVRGRGSTFTVWLPAA